MRILLSFLLPVACACAADPVITYDQHIFPIFREHCMKCHGEDEPKAGLNLSSHATVLKGGSGGAAVVAGRSSASLLFRMITEEDEDKRMPLRNPPLAPPQIELIRREQMVSQWGIAEREDREKLFGTA